MLGELITTAFPAIPTKIIEPIAMPLVLPLITLTGVVSPVGSIMISSMVMYGAGKITFKMLKTAHKVIFNKK